MRLLHEAMRDAVTAIANGDARPIGASLHKVHAAREATEHALHSKAYKPPKNGDKLGRFEELDRAFHGDLESLLEASQKNDLPATAAALGKALGSCNGCHSEFRF
jgi:cytochrome c556